MTREDADQRISLKQAYIGAMRSKDPSSHVGTLLRTRHDGDYVGWNHFPWGVGPEMAADLYADRDRKLRWIVHAECDAILQAVRVGASCRGATMFCTWGPCTNCAKHVIQSGITTFVRHGLSRAQWPDRWAHDVDEADEMLRIAGVEVREFDGPIGGVTNLVNGQVWSP